MHAAILHKIREASIFDICFQVILTIECPKFCYRYVAQPSLYKKDKLYFRFSQITKKTLIPKIAIVTGGYQAFFIHMSPLTVALPSKNGLIIEMLHL